MNYDKRILNEFISEVKEHLEATEIDLMVLEKSGTDWDEQTIAKIFRNIHTIKGNAGFFNLTNITNLTHSMETLLSQVRSGGISPSSTLIDTLLQAVDTMESLLQNIETSNTQNITPIIEALKEFIPSDSASENRNIRLLDSSGSDSEFEIDSETLKQIPPQHKYLYCLRYNVNEILKDHNITPVSLIKRLTKLGRINKAYVKTPFRDLHEGLPEETFIYNIIFSTVVDPDQIADAVCLDPVRIIQLTFEKKEPEKKQAEDFITRDMIEKFIRESRDLMDSTETLILTLEKKEDDEETIAEAFRLMHSLKGNAGFFEYHNIEKACMEFEEIFEQLRQGKLTTNTELTNKMLQDLDLIRDMLNSIAARQEEGADFAASDTEDEYKPVGQILLDMGELSESDLETALRKQRRKLGEILVEENLIARQTLDKALARQQKQSPGGKDQFSRYAFTKKDIRVDMHKLDKLFDLMGELVTAEAMIIAHPAIKNLELNDFNKTAAYLSKITKEMQEITMAIRMIPLEGLFHKMNRLIRDLARKFEKDVECIITGEETEMDRTVIEEIADPLIHLIRNSLDHGIEKGMIREAAGKKRYGTIELRAKYEGNEVWIEVKDDGAGLNYAKILKRARERGLLNAAEADPGQEQIAALIFEPGFSTADKVSAISGRGVGMDVVKRNLEKLRGKVDIKSTPGLGTIFTLKIPLTLAIIDGVIVKVGKMLYAIPIIDIMEFHKAEKNQITSVQSGQQVLQLRESIYPVIRIWDFFSIQDAFKDVSEGIMIICRDSSGRFAALLVDEIVCYQQIVIKPLPEYLGKKEGISGCSIMGNGDINLIMDIGAVIDRSLDNKILQEFKEEVKL